MQVSAPVGFLGWVRDEDASRTDAEFVAFRHIVAMAIFVESWNALRYLPYQPDFGLHVGIALANGAALALAWRGRWTRAACGAMLLGLAAQVAIVFPENANHQYLLVFILLLLVLPESSVSHERAWSLAGIRWFVVIGLFWAGAQKMLYGYYWNGDFLAHRTAVDPYFQTVFRHLMPGAEFERLIALGTERGAGPFRVSALPFVIVSNLSWICELLLPVLMVVRRTRRVGVVAAIAFLFAIQLGAREVYFAALMLAMMLLYWPGGVLARFERAFVAFYALLMASNVVHLARGFAS